jgi:hypothetical protein
MSKPNLQVLSREFAFEARKQAVSFFRFVVALVESDGNLYFYGPLGFTSVVTQWRAVNVHSVRVFAKGIGRQGLGRA